MVGEEVRSQRAAVAGHSLQHLKKLDHALRIVTGVHHVLQSTGIGLLLLPSQEPLPAQFYLCVYAKTALFVIAVGLFCYTSWVLWPARVMASEKEIPGFHRTFRLIAITLLLLVGLSMTIGVVSSHLE